MSGMLSMVAIIATIGIAVQQHGHAGPVRSMTYAAWRATTPVTIATREEVEEALREAGLPPWEAAALAEAAVECEAPVRDRDGTSIGARLAERGDRGLAHGAFAVRVDAHPHLAARYDLDTLAGAAAAAVEIRNEAERIWGDPLRPWSCVR